MSLINRPKASLLIFSLSLLLSSLCNAEESQSDEFEDELADFYGDEDFVSIATGARQQISKAPAIATVITQQDIINMGARNISEILDTVPGLHASRSGQLMSPEFWFRGITSAFNPHTLMMINGISTKSSVRGDNHVVWGEFPVHAIDRIEIIRGPGSALYGADAFSGVINIITKKANSNAIDEIGGMLGSFNTRNLWTNKGFQLDDWRFALNFEYLESDGYEGAIEADAQTAIDNFASTIGVPPVSLAPGNMYSQFKSLDLWLSGENDWLSFDIGVLKRFDLGTNLGATEVLDEFGRSSGYKNLLSVSLKETEISKDISVNSKLSFYASSQEIEEDFLLFPKGAFFGAFPDGFIGNPGWEEETTKFELEAKYSGFEKTSLRLGVGYERQNLYKVVEEKNFHSDLSPRAGGLEDVSDTDEVFMPEADRESHFFYFQSVSRIAPDWELTAGARLDEYTDFGSTLNPRLALVWSATQKLTSKLLYGRAFRAPAFAELIVVNNPIALGNPDLKPETIDTYEVAFNYNWSPDLHFDINVYNYRVTDFISFLPNADGQTATAQNDGTLEGKGVEGTMNYNLFSNLKLLANVAYVKATNTKLDDDVGDFPNWQGYVRSEWTITDDWRVNAQLSLLGSRERVSADTRRKLDGYTLFNLSTVYLLPESSSKIELIISNLFDEDIREPSSAGTTLGAINVPGDLPQAGRAIYLRVSTTY